MSNSAKRKPPAKFDENPEWTTADFKAAKPMAEVDPGFVEILKRGPGRPKIENPKVQISIRLDANVIDALKATGPGWQVRVNQILSKAVKPRASVMAHGKAKRPAKSPHVKAH